MSILPPDSPIDLRALVLYDIHQWKTAGKSYKSYEKLCELLGKETISYEDYEHWFNQYLKENYDLAQQKKSRPIPDIRGCILSDVINEKSIKNSYFTLCEAFRRRRVDKKDHGYWFKRFKNGKLFTRVTFSDLPEDMIYEIVENCDMKTFLNLRKVSHGLRNIVNHSKPPYTDINVKSGKCHVYIKLNNKVSLVFSNQNGLSAPDQYVYKYKHKDYTKKASKLLESALKNSKFRLNTLHVEIRNNRHEKNDKMILDLFNSLNHKIQVERCTVNVQNNIDVITVLKRVKPGTLKSLAIIGFGEFSSTGQLVEMEQWKRLRNFDSDYILDTSIEHFFHFATFKIHTVSLSLEDVMKLTHVFSNSSNFKIGGIYVHVEFDMNAIKRALNLKRDYSTEMYPNLFIYVFNNCVHFKKVNFRQ